MNEEDGSDRLPFSTMLGAYLMIALAWPLSVAFFVYGLVILLVTGEQSEDGSSTY